jgi:hypothetical protein
MAEPRLAGVIVITGQIFTLTTWAPEQPMASVTVTVTAVPVVPLVAAVGVPLTTPVLPASVRPAGKVPEVIAYVYGAVPPAAVIVVL